MKYNIGLFNDSFPPTIDGVANTIFNYAKIISDKFGYCTVVTPKYPTVVDDYNFEVFRYSSIEFSKKFEYRVGNAMPVKTLYNLKNKNFDLLHVHSPFVSSLVAGELLKLKPGIPLVLTYHTKFDIEIAKRIKLKSIEKVARKFVLTNIKRADEVWVVSEGAATSLKEIGYKGPYTVMRNGTDFKVGRASDEVVDNLKQKYDIKKDEIVFLYVGRMMWYKNLKLIVDAIRLLPTDLKFKMVFVGDGNDRPAVEQYVKHIGISKKCVFTGAIYDREILRDYYSMGDLFIFPSTYDTSGLVVMEAAATELPAVLVKGSCASEGVIDGVNGYLCDENIKSIKDKIVEAVSDKDKLKQVSKEAQKTVYFSWEDSVAKAYERYEQIIENYKPKRFFGRKKDKHE